MDTQETVEQEVEQELDALTAGQDFDEAFEEAVDEFRGDDGQQEPEAQPEAQEPEQEQPKDEFEVDKYLEAKNAPPEEAIPQGWAEGNIALQNAWKGFPPEVKAEIRRREQDRTRFMQQEVTKAQDLQKELEPMQNVAKELSNYADKWALEEKPLSVAEGIRQGVALREYIKNTPNIELAKQFLQASGARPEDLIDSPQSEKDLELQTLRDEINQLKMSAKDSEEQAANEAALAENQALSARIMQRYNAFASTLNVNGQQKYPSANDQYFAKEMGSQIAMRYQEAPQIPLDEHIKAVYVEMGGQVLNGSEIRYSQNNTEQLREAATSGYSKGQGSAPSPALFDNHDDAWNATLEEFGLLDE